MFELLCFHWANGCMTRSKFPTFNYSNFSVNKIFIFYSLSSSVSNFCPILYDFVKCLKFLSHCLRFRQMSQISVTFSLVSSNVSNFCHILCDFVKLSNFCHILYDFVKRIKFLSHFLWFRQVSQISVPFSMISSNVSNFCHILYDFASYR
jgi:dimeric dUTPase (all-alpha-NTP-PPase superfamily)